MNRLRFVCGVSLGLVFWTTVAFGAVLDFRDGVLWGAFDIDVNGTSYDVSFQDGTCIELYDGCDENTDFPFTNLANLNDGTLGEAANRALLDQVFLNSALGDFDSQPELTNGCFVEGGCQVNTPLWVNAAGGLGVQTTFNHERILDAEAPGFDHTGQGGGSRTFDTTHIFPEHDQNVYAVWSKRSGPPQPIPAPSSMLLFTTGVAGMIGWQRWKGKMRNGK